MSNIVRQVDFQPEHLFCKKHREPLECQWPAAFQRGLQCFKPWVETNDSIQREASFDPDELPAVLLKTPFCCRLTPKELLQVYEKIGGPELICEVCHRTKMGGRYRRLTESGLAVQHRHVCFECICQRMKEHGAKPAQEPTSWRFRTEQF